MFRNYGFKSLAALALCAGLVASPAKAAIQANGSGIPAGSGSIVTSSTGSIVFSWSSTPYAAFQDFTLSTLSELYLDAFVSNGSLADVTGWIVDVLDSPSGSVVSRLTNDTNFANSAPAPLTGNTNLFGLTGATNSLASQPDSMTPLLTLPPGSYRLGVYDSATPSMATASFRLSEVTVAPIPEAASGLVWLVGLGIVGAYRRS